MLDIFESLPGHTQGFLLLIGSLTVLFQINFRPKTVSYGPTILTTTGILATFFGIALGLYHFDASNIQASVPSLLSGLKTAFWASVAGVGGALTIKFRHYFFGVSESPANADSRNEEEITAGHLALQLRAIQQALVGDDESTLVSQLKLTRSDTNDRLDALKKAQIDALQKLSEMGSKALVEALKDVIRDFNQKITEQFGENFRHLNDAVGKLLVWQQENKEQMLALTGNISSISASMTQASESYKDVVEKASTFTQVARDLSSLLSSLQIQKEQLNVVLRELATLLLSASGSLPQIEGKIIELTQQLSSAVTTNQREINRALSENAESQRNLVESINKSVSALGQETTKQIANFASEMGAGVHAAQRMVNTSLTEAHQIASTALDASREQISKAIEASQDKASRAIADSHKQSLTSLSENSEATKTALSTNSDLIRTSIQSASETIAKSNQEFNRQVSELTAKTKEQVTALDAALAEELKKSLESLGRQLSALSEKFVQDYAPLTDKLRLLVQVGHSA